MPLGGKQQWGGKAEQAEPDQTKRSGVRQVKRDEVERSITTNSNTNGLFDDYYLLTIKDTANNISKHHLRFLVQYCLKFLKSTFVRDEIEFGKQGYIHVHAVLKLNKSSMLPNGQALSKYLKKYSIFYEESTETMHGHIVERHLIDTKSLLVHISPIKDASHKSFLETFYLRKEKINYDDIHFID